VAHEKRDRRLELRVTTAERALLDERANELGMQAPSLARLLLRRWLGLETPGGTAT
jgi:hypothetical protein